MDSREILKFCLENGLLVDKDVLNLFSDTSDVESVKMLINRIKNETNQKILTKQSIDENRDQVNKIFLELPEEKQKDLENFKVKLGLSIEISKEISASAASQGSERKEIVIQEPEIKANLHRGGGNVSVVSMPEIQSKKLEVKDFVTYFKKRFFRIRDILQGHSALGNVVSINKISGNRQGVSIIGLVKDKKITKNKNILLEVEDLTGTIRVLINQNKPELYEKAEDIPLDGVIGFKGSGNREILFANEIVFPDSALPERKRSDKEEWALFTGDLHIGSKLFLEDNFLKFIDYLNGKVPNTPEVSKIKYLFLIGDLVAGAGIYQGQENELNIIDVEEQYNKAAELLSKIRKDIKIIICPGNHDVMRIMEPQPVLDEKYAWRLYNLKNVVLVRNPTTVGIGQTENFSGFDVLMYHGYSFHYYANNISRLIQEKAAHHPEKIMHYLLMNRHLAPSHSSTLYFPSEEDPFFIEKVPDIFIAGHTHKSGISYYNNVLVISSSTWESMTGFQERLGNEPDFCKVPMFNLKTRAVKILDFE
jgi:DNA polymerase II small subunit